MRVSLFVNKSLEENASHYFEQAKKARKKLNGARKAFEISKKKSVKKQGPQVVKQKKVRKLEWYEKFRWFITSQGILCIGGRDATSNEIIIKKHAHKGDKVLHTQMAGSPFMVIKSDGKPIPEKSIVEAAIFTATNSKAWKTGMSTSLVEYVDPEQVTKEAQAGEYLEKGSFMIRGKTRSMTVPLECAICMKDDKIMSGPLDAAKAHSEEYVEVVQGDDKPSQVARAIKSRIGGELDDIIRSMPSGGCKIKKSRKN